jgi:hypothetical protein
MHILDYDEFNIYTTLDDVKEYVNELLSEGYEFSEEIYTMCVTHFGDSIKPVINSMFYEEN